MCPSPQDRRRHKDEACFRPILNATLHFHSTSEPLELPPSLKVDIGFEFTSYYAGHVLGAAMFFVRVGHQTVLYTGERGRGARRWVQNQA